MIVKRRRRATTYMKKPRRDEVKNSVQNGVEEARVLLELEGENGFLSLSLQLPLTLE